MAIDGEILRELDHMRDEFRTALASQQSLADERERANAEAVRTARMVNDARLGEMNEFRGALADQTARLITRTESEAARNALADKTDEALGALGAKLDSEIKPIHTRLELLSRPNWALLMSGLSVAMVLIGGTYTIVGLAIATAIQPNSTAIVALVEHDHQQDATLATVASESGASTAADLVSRGDRLQMNARVQLMENSISVGASDRRAAVSAIQEKLLEIETQFCSEDMARNLMHAQDLRVTAMIWDKVMPTKLPTDNAYYPIICSTKRQ